MDKMTGAAAAAAGLALAYAGWRWDSSFERQAKDFHGNPSGDRWGVKRLAARIILILGLVLALVFAPMFWIG